MPVPASKLRVLICEREYLLALDAATQLELAGATVAGCCSDYSEVLSAALMCNVALIDLEPAEPGFFVAIDALLAANIPIVLTTAYGKTDLPDVYRHLTCLPKPIDFDALVDCLCDLAIAT